MDSRIQLLIPEGELNVIYNMVMKRRGNKIIGSLYGLWRNSLKQPVVHIAIGPGSKAKLRPDGFHMDIAYHEKCKKYFKENHGLLQIGLWLSGSPSRYPIFDPQNPRFQMNNDLMPSAGKFCVLMFVEPSPPFELIIVDRRQPRNSKSDRLYQEDILAGESSFRLLEQISAKIRKGAMFTKPTKNTFHISRGDLSSFTKARRPVVNVSEEQWYDSADGASLLALLMDTFERYRVSVEMSRNTNSHDLIFELNGKLSLNFPREFPEKEPSLSWTNDRVRDTRNHDDICRRLVEKVTSVLRAI